MSEIEFAIYKELLYNDLVLLFWHIIESAYYKNKMTKDDKVWKLKERTQCSRSFILPYHGV